MTTNDFTTHSSIAAGPLAGAAEYLSEQGWVSIEVPLAKRPQQQIVVLAGRGGVLVIGTHKTSDASLGDLAGVVTASLPARLRACVVTENGHDPRSLPTLADELGERLTAEEVSEATESLSELNVGLLTVARVLEWTRDAKPAPSRFSPRHGRTLQVANFLSRYAMVIALLVVIATAIAFAVATGSDAGAQANAGAAAAAQLQPANASNIALGAWGNPLTGP